MLRFNHNHFVVAFVTIVCAFLGTLAAGHPEIPLAELTGQALHRLAMYAGFIQAFIYFFGGVGFDPIELCKTNAIATANFLGLIIVGAALVIAL